jgi:hypothetical protein
VTHLDGCQIPCLPRMSDGLAEASPQPLVKRLKRALAMPWNYYVKKWLKWFYRLLMDWKVRYFRGGPTASEQKSAPKPTSLQAGDWVRVRPVEDIRSSLNPWKELKGCAFLPYMVEYCGTTQRVLQPVERFLDERDYKVKKAKGVVLLEGVICHGTPVFGRCDRCCHLFWREEWLEKIDLQSEKY